jgi:hypothetical protein
MSKDYTQAKRDVMSEWISVKERLPPAYLFVLVFCETGTDEPSSFSLARWDNDHWTIIGDGESVWDDLHWGINSDNEITHWMPLPEPPTEGK